MRAILSIGVVVTISSRVTAADITVSGCVREGVESGCWVMSGDDGKTYSFISSNVTAGQCYKVTGKSVFGFCMQGTQLSLSAVAPSPNSCCYVPCTDFAGNASSDPNAPWTKNGVVLTTYDFQGNPVAKIHVDDKGGLFVNRKLVIDLPVPTKTAFVASVQVDSKTNTWIGYDASGTVVDSVTLDSGGGHPIKTVVLVGPGITRVVSETVNNEGELFSFCVK